MENELFCNSNCNNDLMNVNNAIVALSQDTEEDDFDKLLDAFIKESLGDETPNVSTDDVPQSPDDDGPIIDEGDCSPILDDDDSIICKIGQGTFLLPRCPGHCCTATGLFMDEGKYEIQKLRGQPLLFTFESNDARNIIFTLKGVDNTLFCKEPEIYIYSQDSIHPIEIIKFNMDTCECKAYCDVSSCIEKIAYGNYMLFVRGVVIEGFDSCYRCCEGGYCVPFIKADGGNMGLVQQHSELRAAIDKGGCRLNVSLLFPCNVDKETAFSLFMYNDDYNLVARGAAFVRDNFGRRPKRCLKISLTTDYQLFGNYFALLARNGRPYCRIELGIDNCRVERLSTANIAPFDKEYLMFTELEKSFSWQKLRNMSVSKSIKEYTIQGYMLKFFNLQRRRQRLNALTRMQHFVYDAREAAEELEAVKALSSVNYDCNSFEAVDCITLCEAKNAADPYSDATELFDFCAYKCIAMYNISAFVNYGAPVVKKMINAMERCSTLVVCLMGNPSEIALLREAYPQLMRYFPAENYVARSEIEADVFVSRVVNELHNCDLCLAPRALRLLIDAAKKGRETGRMFNLSSDDIKDFVKSKIIDNFIARTLKNIDAQCVADKKYLSTIEAEDINLDTLLRNDTKEFEESIEELNRMVGLGDVKKNIITTFNRLKNNAERRRLGLRIKEDECHHMIFTGNPGTGKTTVAKMVGRIYRALGLLSKGEVIYTDRGKIVGRYIGDTEHNMQCLLAEAKGNVLFIDEAYTLCDTLHDRKDYGYRAIECLLTALTQKNSDMIVIFAGYEKEMETMMHSNQGLSGRFPYKFRFEDYTADELMQIAERKLADEDYELDAEAHALLRDTINDTVRDKGWDFHNARWVEQYVCNGIIPAQGDRLMRISRPKSRDEYRRIKVEDIRVAFLEHKPKSNAKGRRREIGFIA